MSADGLYIHIPYCYDKCTYCDFNSAPIEGAPVGRYLAALQKEIETLPPGFAPHTVFFGGGTPTALAATQLDDLLTHLAERVDLAEVTEFSMEANPGTVTEKKMALIMERGVNRLSVGAQSFDDRQLKSLGRIHEADQIGRTVEMARAAGFKNLSLDLIFALPGQTAAEWRETLKAAVALEPEHLSAYGLTYEAGTPLTAALERGEVARADEERELAMLRETETLLKTAGYRRYEISNYARPGRECRHNVLYWRNRPYRSVGTGAVSYLDGRRWRNESNPAAYAAKIEAGDDVVEFEETLDPAASFRESVVLGLRMCDGVDVAEIERRSGLKAETIYNGEIEELCANGLLTVAEGRVRLTARGMELADEVMARLV